MIDLKMLKKIDWATILLVLLLVGFGLVSIASIMATPFDGTESSLNDFIARLNLNYVKKQAVNFLVGIAAFLIVIVFDYQVYKPLIKFIYIGNLGLLALLLIASKTTKSRSSSRSWLSRPPWPSQGAASGPGTPARSGSRRTPA
jgi:cell division protein FtsW (lipid II flippase)